MFRSKCALLFFTSLFSLFAAACADSGTGPTTQHFQGELAVEGHVTSDVDGSPISQATILVFVQQSCGDFCLTPPKIIVVAETATNASGFYSLSFHDQRCVDNESVAEFVSADRFVPSFGIVFCRDGLQNIDFRLLPTPPVIHVGIDITTLIAGQPSRFSYTARSDWGLASVSITWGDDSPVEIIPATGLEQQGEVTHTFSKPGQYTGQFTVTDSLEQTSVNGPFVITIA